MSINWVMVSPGPEAFVKLPNEQILYKSPARTTLDLSNGNGYPGTQSFSVKSDGGVAYVTNQRIVYLPTNPTPTLQNFSCPILNLQDTYVRAPFFGANYWTAAVKPVSGGGIPSSIPMVELKMTFREGGAFDFHTTFERIKERLYNAVQLAREEGRNIRGPTGGVDLANVHLDELPAYEPASPTQHSLPAPVASSSTRDSAVSGMESQQAPKPDEATFTPPNEPPPGYEEAQAQAVGIDLDQRLREAAERQ